ncbi:MAG TPA: PIN domain-containing protein [Vicinamibacterales bacterium]|nr:PIN domain-containing protein [Vicinamibacterales bacterium]
MAAHVVVDAGFLVALLSRRDAHHAWAVTAAEQFPPPWFTCESALSEAFHLLGVRGAPALRALLERQAVQPAFVLGDDLDAVLQVMEKYEDVPASLADASIVRMTETLAEPTVLTTDADFRVYRRHGRRTVPCVLPS